MKILIIEDDPNKLGKLSAFVKGCYSDADITTASSYNSGLQKVLSSDWSVVLLDIQLPTFDKSPNEPGGRQRALAGQQILRRMARANKMIPAIVVTQFEHFGEGAAAISLRELTASLRNGDYPNYMGTVYYHANLSEWKPALKGLLVMALEHR